MALITNEEQLVELLLVTGEDAVDATVEIVSDATCGDLHVQVAHGSHAQCTISAQMCSTVDGVESLQCRGVSVSDGVLELGNIAARTSVLLSVPVLVRGAAAGAGMLSANVEVRLSRRALCTAVGVADVGQLCLNDGCRARAQMVASLVYRKGTLESFSERVAHSYRFFSPLRLEGELRSLPTVRDEPLPDVHC